MRNQRFDTSATRLPPRSILYSWSTMLPFASMSSPFSISIEKRSRNGVSQRLLDRRHGLAAALDLHRVADVEKLLLNLVELGSGGILEHERVPEAQDLAVDLERALARVVLDPVVVADREHLLAHPVRRSALVAAVTS